MKIIEALNNPEFRNKSHQDTDSENRDKHLIKLEAVMKTFVSPAAATTRTLSFRSPKPQNRLRKRKFPDEENEHLLPDAKRACTIEAWLSSRMNDLSLS